MSEALQNTIDCLREEVRQLREQLAPHVSFPREWALYSAERSILAALLARKGPVTREALLAAGCRANSSPDTVGVHICRLRKKLKPLGVRILTDWSNGYELTSKSREIIQKALAQ